jgi:hypothetical protein
MTDVPARVMTVIWAIVAFVQFVVGVLALFALVGGAIAYLYGNTERGTKLLINGAVWAVVWVVIGAVFLAVVGIVGRRQRRTGFFRLWLLCTVVCAGITAALVALTGDPYLARLGGQLTVLIPAGLTGLVAIILHARWSMPTSGGIKRAAYAVPAAAGANTGAGSRADKERAMTDEEKKALQELTKRLTEELRAACNDYCNRCDERKISPSDATPRAIFRLLDLVAQFAVHEGLTIDDIMPALNAVFEERRNEITKLGLTPSRSGRG